MRALRTATSLLQTPLTFDWLRGTPRWCPSHPLVWNPESHLEGCASSTDAYPILLVACRPERKSAGISSRAAGHATGSGSSYLGRQWFRGPSPSINGAHPFEVARRRRAFARWSLCVIGSSPLQGLAISRERLSTLFGMTKIASEIRLCLRCIYHEDSHRSHRQLPWCPHS
jgi:hypothetical protein